MCWRREISHKALHINKATINKYKLAVKLHEDSVQYDPCHKFSAMIRGNERAFQHLADPRLWSRELTLRWSKTIPAKVKRLAESYSNWGSWSLVSPVTCIVLKWVCAAFFCQRIVLKGYFQHCSFTLSPWDFRRGFELSLADDKTIVWDDFECKRTFGVMAAEDRREDRSQSKTARSFTFIPCWLRGLWSLKVHCEI